MATLKRRRDSAREAEEFKKAHLEMEELIERVGVAEAVRITAERSPRAGDYTKERHRLLRGMTLDDWMREMYPGLKAVSVTKSEVQPAQDPLQRPHKQLIACWARLAPRLLEAHR